MGAIDYRVYRSKTKRGEADIKWRIIISRNGYDIETFNGYDTKELAIKAARQYCIGYCIGLVLAKLFNLK